MIRIGRAVSIEDNTLINMLFAILIYANTIIDMFRMLNQAVMHSGDGLTSLFQMAVYAVFFCGVALLALANRQTLRRMATTLWLYVLAVSVSLIVNSQIMPLLKSSVIVFVIRIAPAFVLSSMLTDFDDAIRYVEKMKWIIVAYMIVFLTVGRSDERYYYMHVGYNLLYPTLLLLFWDGKHSLANKLIAIASILVIILFCARGTALVMVPAVGLYYLIRTLRVKSNGKKIMAIVLVLTACIAVLLSYDAIFEYLYEIFPDSRTLRYIAEGEMMDSSGRDDFYELGIQELLRNPLGFKGIYGDRIFYAWHYHRSNPQGYFAHNVILEFLLQYGIFFGGLAGIVFLIAFVAGVFSGLRSNSNAAVSLVCAVVLPFFIISMSTASYLDTFETAVMLGLCIAFRKAKRKPHYGANNRRLILPG